MNTEATKSVIIVAGGSGKRMKSSIPKQFLDLDGLPVLMHTINAFYRYRPEMQLILVLPEDQLDHWKHTSERFNFDIPLITVPGGATRFHSVKNGLEEVSKELVAIHDGVRPFVPESVIDEAYKSAAVHGSGVVAVPLKDSIRKGSMEQSESQSRKDFFLIQTPQVFQTTLLTQAFDQEYREFFTDDASVFESAGHDIQLVMGDYKNIKITTPEDMIIADAFIRNH